MQCETLTEVTSKRDFASYGRVKSSELVKGQQLEIFWELIAVQAQSQLKRQAKHILLTEAKSVRNYGNDY